MRSVKITRFNHNFLENRQKVNERIHAERAENPLVKRKTVGAPSHSHLN
ncbi:hypothetical protein [Oceanobacillus salinisoli]|nr:hypothetical protein [Oceanobacillus salinisoli]